jgi:4-hydroxy-2-oxoheptanedioate aldolase
LKTNLVRQKILAGEPTLGAFLGLGSPNVAELMAYAGFDWLVIETEHNGLDSAQIEHMLMALNGTDVVPIVRVPSAGHVSIQRALDMGSLGILVPMVKTVEEAETVVRATRYPPAGTRSFGPLRASRYTFDNQDYFERANDNILVLLILETKEALDDLVAIMSITGVDGVYLGPFDLSLSLGFNPMHQPLPEIGAATQRALVLGKAKGVAVGIGCSTPEELRQRRVQGFTLLGFGSDYGLLVKAARLGVEAFINRESIQ